MQTLTELYDYHASSPSDINEHMATLKKYAKGCDHVVEFGVRWVCSTWGLMAGLPKKLTSYDVNDINSEKLKLLHEVAESNDVEFNFYKINVLDCDIEECDVLFIDTLHGYMQLSLELSKHKNKVRKYIILHDTVTYGQHDEGKPDLGPCSALIKHVASILPRKQGLVAAYKDFLEQNPDWKLCVSYGNNNGLTILEKV